MSEPVPVIILDDSLTVRMDLAQALDEAGLRAIPCGTVQEARRAWQDVPYAVIILDVMLPETNGIAVLQDLRNDPRTAGFPVIMLSAETDAADRALGLRTGADDYIGKPYEASFVVARVRELARPYLVSHESQQSTILLIDDSRTFRSVLAESVAASGYQVIEADTGEAGLQIAGVRPPDAIVIDGVLPGIGGAEVVRRLRLDAALRHVPCMLLTGSGDLVDEVLALDSGVDVFARKDEEIPVILARLTALLRRTAGQENAAVASSLLGSKRILLVSDDPDYSHWLGEQLRREGCDVLSAQSETTALNLLEVQPVDCIVLDARLSGTGGETVCHRIKTQPGMVDIPLVLVADGGDPDAMMTGFADGADDCCDRHSDGAVIRARVLAQIRRHRFDEEQQRQREQAMVSDRLASIGMLAAGVAHEINNPLAAILANLELALQDVAQLGETPVAAMLREELLDAQEAAGRVRSIVRDLKVFSRADEETEGAVDVLAVLESTLRMAWTEIRHRATLVKRLNPVPLVKGSESRLGQVFLNLIVNAVQALPDGHADQQEVRIATRTDDHGRVVVEVADTGSGMSPALIRRLFTPFFTTKPVGTGTGLGLSICHRIVTALGGEIRVESEVGKGSVFQVLLPPADTGLVSPAPVAVSAPAGQSRGRVLVVDDERIVLTAVQRLLQARHEVVIAQDPREALAWIQSGQHFDVILCDLMMPAMTGMDFHEAVRRVDGAQAGRMIFMTAEAFTPAAKTFLESVPNARLEKPFDVALLSSLIETHIGI